MTDEMEKFPEIVVTGIAMTTAVGTDVESTWQALLDGRSGIRTLEDPFIEEFDLPVRIGGHLLETFDEELTPEEHAALSYVQRMAVVLGRRVWKDAGAPDVDPDRLAVSIGTGMGGIEELLFAYEHIRELRLDQVNPDRGPAVRTQWPCRGRRHRTQSAGGRARHPSRHAHRVRRASRRPGGTSFSAKPTSRSAAESKPRSRRCRSPDSPRCASCCRRTTTTPPARAGRSTVTGTASCSARAAR